MTDDSLINDSGSDYWLDDVVDIYVDGNYSQRSSYDGLDDLHMLCRWNDDANHRGPPSVSLPSGIQRSAVNTGNGYRMEFAIPLAGINISATDGYEFGIDVHVIDDDNGGDRDHKLAWNSVVDETYLNPSLIGGAILVERADVATTSADLIAGRLEVTQAIQDLNNSVRLVAGKRTFVRFHASSAKDIYLSSARLGLRRSDEDWVWLVPLNGGSGRINVSERPNRLTINDSFLFELPTEYTSGNLELVAQVNPATSQNERELQESDYSNNEVSTIISFEQVPPLNLVLYKIAYGETNSPVTPRDFHLDMLIRWLRKAFPVSQLNFQVRTEYIGRSLPTCGGVNALLASRRVWDRANNSNIVHGTRYYGMVDDTGGFMRGCATLGGFVGSGPTGTGSFSWDFDGSYGDWYGAHELAHNYARQHANFCGAIGGATYPYPDGHISRVDSGTDALFGFDIDTVQVYGPTWADVMSYCTKQWVSDFTYEGLMDFFQQNPSGPNVRSSSIQTTIVPMPHLQIAGVIHVDTEAVDLQPIFVINSEPLNERMPGDYTIVLYGENSDELVRYPFTPIEMHEARYPQQGVAGSAAEEYLLINELVLYVEGIIRVDIEGPNGILTAVEVNDGTPTVTVVSPNGGEIISETDFSVTWDASDPDNDPLTYNIQYSNDGGNTWILIAQNVVENQVTVDTTNLGAGNNGLIQVWATDGINTVNDQSDAPFTIPRQALSIEITEFPDENIILLGQTIRLESTIYNIDITSVDRNKLKWSSNIDGK